MRYIKKDVILYSSIVLVKEFWDKISNIGVKPEYHVNVKDIKRINFFNQVLVLGFFGVFLQIAISWPFIGFGSLTFLLVPFASFISFYLNSKGKFHFSKIFFVFMVHLTGVITILQLGGDGLYHLNVFATFTFGLILFDSRKEYLEIVFGFVAMIFIISLGELEVFNTPDFSKHPYIESFKLINICNLICLNSIMTIFILKLNVDTEKKLVVAVNQQDDLLSELTIKTDELDNRRKSLEKMVISRTYEISSQKDALEVKNKEKEVLLQEVHHRVKNNLQIIISLINLQLSKFDDEAIETALKEIQTRVLSMSLVHRKMYETTNFTEIKLKEYVDQLVDNIKTLYPDSEFSFDNQFPDELLVDMESAIPLGFIFNEIAINYCKHGIEEANENSELTFSMNTMDDKKIEFTCKDNGSGFESIDAIDESKSLGLQIIQGLAEQLDGDFNYFNDEGAVYSFTAVCIA